jgi:hypothetical protein
LQAFLRGSDALASMLQDVIKNRRTEIDYLNGYVSDEGKKVSVPTPFCDAASALVRAAGVGGISPDPSETQETKTQGLLSFLFWPHLIFFWQSDDLSRQARDRQKKPKAFKRTLLLGNVPVFSPVRACIKPFFLNVSYVYPEPVLVKSIDFSIKFAPKSRFPHHPRGLR